MEKKPKMSNIEEKTVYSSCLIGDRAKAGEELSLFVTPRGQYMPMVPREANRCTKCNQPAGRVLADLDTNIMQAGQMGSAIGDAKFEKISAKLVNGGDPVVLEAEVELRIAGRTIMTVALDKLIKGPVQINDTTEYLGKRPPEAPDTVPYCLVARTDTVEARLRLTRDTKIAGDAVQVQLLIEGKFMTDADPYSAGELIGGDGELPESALGGLAAVSPDELFNLIMAESDEEAAKSLVELRKRAKAAVDG